MPPVGEEKQRNDPFEIGDDPIGRLAVADPDVAAAVSARLAEKQASVTTAVLAMLVEEILTAMAQEISFGRVVGAGLADLVGAVDDRALTQYCRMIRAAGASGPTLGSILATYLVPVLKYGDDSHLKRLTATVDILRKKGTYTLKAPLAVMALLLREGDLSSAAGYLDLLCGTFSQELTYNRCQHLCRELPRAVRRMAPARRSWQMAQMHRIVRCDIRMIGAFLDGMTRGLDLLRRPALEQFVATALAKSRGQWHLGCKFMALESRSGIEALADLQVTVPFSRVRTPLNRYVQARTGRTVSLRPMSALPAAAAAGAEGGPAVLTDGRFIYLPDEIDHFDTRAENLWLYKTLAKLEAGLHEFATFDFDLERLVERYPDLAETVPVSCSGKNRPHPVDGSDLERFFEVFPHRDLAVDLFTVFEHGRLRIMNDSRYPGLGRGTMPLLHREARRAGSDHPVRDPVAILYRRIALNMAGSDSAARVVDAAPMLDAIVRRFESAMAGGALVEASAWLTATSYDTLRRLVPAGTGYSRLTTPYGRCIRPDRVHASIRAWHRVAHMVKQRLSARNVQVFKADLVRGLAENRGVLAEDQLREIIRLRQETGSDPARQARDGQNLSRVDLSGIFEPATASPAISGEAAGDIFWYREWNRHLGDYLPDHVRLVDRPLAGSGNGFYGETLKKHVGLVRKIRFAFELLKPEGLSMLRRWVEGDDFDYRALIDFAIDKKNGRMPSQRLYNKRVKQIRDVAVMLLLDLSRSTANRVPDGRGSVMDVEKEAVVLFCEALGVVGDDFAIAGFSGNGRLGVDYLRIKDFHEPMGEAVRHRIGALAPRRNTRMGAAVRHAAARFAKIPARIRLLMILGDGFPNDMDYKRDYAIEDTRKAILEACAAGLYTHAITVNLGTDARLDDLYGRARHSVISDVRELPDRLPAIYGALTKT